MRYILSSVDISDPERLESNVGTYETIREALDKGRKSNYRCFIIYDTLESRTIINYGDES
jgi:hypothetical protein